MKIIGRLEILQYDNNWRVETIRGRLERLKIVFFLAEQVYIFCIYSKIMLYVYYHFSFARIYKGGVGIKVGGSKNFRKLISGGTIIFVLENRGNENAVE